VTGMDEEPFILIQIHRIHGSGETMTFKCPHCGRNIYVHLKSLELDPDTVEVYWGKSLDDVEMKRRKVEEELENP
jgi:hypothetical protein